MTLFFEKLLLIKNLVKYDKLGLKEKCIISVLSGVKLR